MLFTTAGIAAPRRGRVASAAALTSILLVTGCGGSGGGTTSASTPSSSTSSSTTVPPADLPGLSDVEATLTTLSADETLSSTARKLSDTRSDLADNMTDMRAAVKAALDQRKAARWDCGPLDAKRSAAWSIRTKVTESLEAGDTAYDKLASTLKTFSGKVDDVSAAYDKLEKSASSLSASDAVSSRLDSAGTTIQAIADHLQRIGGRRRSPGAPGSSTYAACLRHGASADHGLVSQWGARSRSPGRSEASTLWRVGR